MSKLTERNCTVSETCHSHHKVREYNRFWNPPRNLMASREIRLEKGKQETASKSHRIAQIAMRGNRTKIVQKETGLLRAGTAKWHVYVVLHVGANTVKNATNSCTHSSIRNSKQNYLKCEFWTPLLDFLRRHRRVPPGKPFYYPVQLRSLLEFQISICMTGYLRDDDQPSQHSVTVHFRVVRLEKSMKRTMPLSYCWNASNLLLILLPPISHSSVTFYYIWHLGGILNDKVVLSLRSNAVTILSVTS